MERHIQNNSWLEIVNTAVKTRKEQKVSQKRLSAITGISTQTISRFEQGQEDIQLSTALKILEALGMKLVQG